MSEASQQTLVAVGCQREKRDGQELLAGFSGQGRYRTRHEKKVPIQTKYRVSYACRCPAWRKYRIMVPVLTLQAVFFLVRNQPADHLSPTA